jgi:CRISPR-associated protein Cmr2
LRSHEHPDKHEGGETLRIIVPQDTQPQNQLWEWKEFPPTFGMTPLVQSQFFLFQVGPVQDFIAQARSTRDLWSGSYLISWLVAHAIKETLRQCELEKSGGIIFPSPQRQPLLGFVVNNEQPSPSVSTAQILTPSLPNRFLAEVPAKFKPEEVAKAFQTEWQDIAKRSWKWLDDRLPLAGEEEIDAVRKQWDFQMLNHWQVTWQVWSMDRSNALDLWKQLPQPPSKPGEVQRELRESPEDQNWVANYELICHRLDARRQTRDFVAWASQSDFRLRDKDAYSGREDSFGGVWNQPESSWFKRASEKRSLRTLFRSKEPLGAANLIKRVWHRAHPKIIGLRRSSDVLAFDSVPAVAAAEWRHHVLKLAGDGSRGASLAEAVESFEKHLDQARDHLPFQLEEEGKPALRNVDASIFHETVWQKQMKDAPAGEGVLREGLTALSRLQKATGLGSPSRYYAVMAMDGDSMGKWIGGEMTGQASKEFHLLFSEAISTFGVGDARKIVEQDHFGSLIYSGGDDVLAMLPAEKAISCAKALSFAFHIAVKAVLDELSELPKRPPATVSVGIAIGHMKEPLQDMVAAAQAAEKRAKSKPLDRNALAITLFKRSGEIIEWGAKFDSPAFALHEEFAKYYRPKIDDPTWKPLISGRFPYQLTKLLQPYQSFDSTNGFPDPARPEKLTPELAEVVLREFEYVTSKQADGLGKDIAEKLAQHAKEYLTDLAHMDTDTGKEAAPLRDFYNIFLIEAFLRRQLDT